MDDDTFDFSDFDSLSDTPESTGPEENGQQTTEVQQDSSTQVNPNWQPYLEGVPDIVRPFAEKAFKAWDQGVSQKFEEHAAFRKQYEPYRDFVEQGVNPELMSMALQMAFQVQQNPVDFFNDLKTQLLQRGLIEEAKQVQQAQDQAQADQDAGNYQDEYQEQIAALKAEQQNMQHMLLERQQQEIYQQTYAEESAKIENDFYQIEQTIGRPLSPQVKHESIQRAMLISQREGGRPVSVIEGFRDLQQFMGSVARKPAPAVLPAKGARSALPTSKPAEDLTLADRQALFVQMMQNG